jgi:cytoskeletal protein RodZ
MEIGARLKEAREEKGLTLESLQESTKIQKRYLEAIEEGKFHILPGTFYTRAFIKEYALAVGLNPEELLEEHENEVPATEKESTVQYTRMQRAGRENRREKNPANFSFIPALIVVLLVIAIIFAGWVFWQKSTSGDSAGTVEDSGEDEIIYNKGEDNSSDSKEKQEADEADEKDQTEKEDDEEAKAPAFTVVEKGTGNSPESELDLNNLPEDVSVQLKVSGDSYLEINGESGETYFSGMAATDQSMEDIDVSDEERIYFNVGNAPALTIKINDAELKYPVDPAGTVHQKIWINLNKEK